MRTEQTQTEGKCHITRLQQGHFELCASSAHPTVRLTTSPLFFSNTRWAAHPETLNDAVEAMNAHAPDPAHQEAIKRDKESKNKDSKNTTPKKDKVPQVITSKAGVVAVGSQDMQIPTAEMRTRCQKKNGPLINRGRMRFKKDPNHFSAHKK